MARVYFQILTCVLISVIKVNAVALQGPALTRYDPCGLGAVHFDKITDRLWQAVVNLGLYKNLGSEVRISVKFEERVRIVGVSQNSTVKVRDNGFGYVFIPKDNITSNYIFYVNLQENGTDIPTVKKFSLNNSTLCDDTVKASETVESLNVTNDDEHYSHVCGRRSLDHAEMTSVRTEAKAGDWPWHVAILIKNWLTNKVNYQCGGSIISRTAIVTAGHCVSKGGVMTATHRIVIIAGISNHSDVNEVGRQIFTAQEVILHPSYNDVDATADLAIIKVSNLRYTKYVQPICIWGPVYDKSNLFGYQATVIGFGKTENNQLSQVLRSAYIMVQNDTTCINFSRKLYSSLLNEFTFCAGYGPTSAINPRNGDSGGGLVVPTLQADHKISWFLRGVLSKCGVGPGHVDCDPQFYVVYTDVGPHYGWIYHHSGLQYGNNILE